MNTSEPFVRFRKMERFNKDLVLKPLSHRDVLLGYVTERERVCYSASWILKPGQHICRVIMLLCCGLNSYSYMRRTNCPSNLRRPMALCELSRLPVASDTVVCCEQIHSTNLTNVAKTDRGRQLK